MENRFVISCVNQKERFEAVNCGVIIKIKSEIISAIPQFGFVLTIRNLNQAGGYT